MNSLNPNIMSRAFTPEKENSESLFLGTPDPNRPEASPIVQKTFNVRPTKDVRATARPVGDRLEKLEKDNKALIQRLHDTEVELGEKTQEIKALQAGANRLNIRDKAKEASETTKLTQRIAQLERLLEQEHLEKQNTLAAHDKEKEKVRNCIESWKIQYGRKTDEVSQMKAQNEELKSQMTAASTAHDSHTNALQSTIAELKSQLQRQMDSASRSNNELSESRKECEKLECAAQTLKVEIEALSKQLQNTQNKVTSAEQETHRLKGTIAELNQRIESTEGRGKNSERDAAEWRSRCREQEKNNKWTARRDHQDHRRQIEVHARSCQITLK
eukprot:PhF_6_TR22519/c0_g1_i2/m.31958